MLKVVNERSHQFQDLSTLQHGWEFTVSQLGPSEEESIVSLYQTANVVYNHFRYSPAYDQRLRSRRGFLSFGLFEPENPSTWTYDQLIPNDAITVFPREEELKGASPAGFCGNGIHFSEKFLVQLAEQVYRRPLETLVPPAGIYIPDHSKLQQLRAELVKWQQLEHYHAEDRPGIVSRREESLAMAFINALVNETSYAENHSTVTESSMVRALEVIHSSELDNISAMDLCRQAGCSQRTLEKCFVKRFSVTPKKYIKCLRLAEVNKGLRTFDSQEFDSIIELAGIHGFWHMGQFAADYRRIYGELPSETLKRK